MTSYKLAETPARIPLGECPICGHKIDAASHISEPGIFADPQPGDFTVCIECGGWLKFGSKLNLLRLDEKDILRMGNEEHDMLSAITKSVRELEARHSKVRQ